MKELIYQTHGTCARAIRVVLDDNQVIQSVQFAGGCGGNTQGVAALARGKKAQEVIAILKGIDCGGKGTSCPDQLSKALEQALAQ